MLARIALFIGLPQNYPQFSIGSAHSSGCVVNGSNAMACSYAYYECHMFIPLLTETPVKFVLK